MLFKGQLYAYGLFWDDHLSPTLLIYTGLQFTIDYFLKSRFKQIYI